MLLSIIAFSAQTTLWD